MNLLYVTGVAWLFTGLALAGRANDFDAGRKAMQHSCIACHSLRLIESQRLSAAAWQKEVDKMTGWGAIVDDRQLLLNYLARHYNNMQPPPTLALSSNRH
jgi:mono/diheme cytochrome c family protein